MFIVTMDGIANQAISMSIEAIRDVLRARLSLFRLLFLSYLVFSATQVFGGILGADEARGVSMSQLLASPQIVLGKVTAIDETGSNVVQRGGAAIDVSVYRALIDVSHVLRGEVPKQLRISNLKSPSNPANYYGHQILGQGRMYVFFLKNQHDLVDYDPVSPIEFALEIEKSPAAFPPDAVESLRKIARENSTANNRFLARDWLKRLEVLEGGAIDLAFWDSKTKDSQVSVRGIALSTLAKNAPQRPGLYTDVLKFLADTAQQSDQGDTREQLCQLLPLLTKGGKPTANDLTNWLSSANKQVKETALQQVRATRNATLVPDIVAQMTKSEDRDFQYQCIKTLFALDHRNLISIDKFMESPAKYIQEWEKVGKDTSTKRP